MNPLFIKVGIGVGVGVLFSAAALLMILLRSNESPHYRNEFTGSYMKDDTAATYTCCVCLEDFNTTSQKKANKLPCGHKFHQICIRKWFTQQAISKSCPYCRRPVAEDVVSQYL